MRKALAATVMLTAMLACGDTETVTSLDDGISIVQGIAYLDRDGDGVFGSGDVLVAGAVVSLLVHTTGDTVASGQTDASGQFKLVRIAAGNYRLDLQLGSMSDSLAVVNSGESSIMVERRDTVYAELRVGYTGLPTTVAGARAMQAGDRVIVSGVALTPSALVDIWTLHMMDATGSIRATGVRDGIAAGDSIRLIGTVGVMAGQPVLLAVTTVIELPGVGLPEPDSVTTAEAAQAAGGVLDAAQVAVSGTITVAGWDASGFVIAVDDGSGALVIQPPRSTLELFAVGQSVRARGVLVPAETGDGWHLSPRSVSEVAVTAAESPCSNGLAGLFPCRMVDLVAFVPIANLGSDAASGLNDIWGWTDRATGREYAIVGRTDGTAFVDISNPVEPVLVANLPMTAQAWSSMWRDMKVYQDHAFVVADGAGVHGMQVVDLTRLREFAGTPLQLTPDALYTEFGSAHNIVINEESGFAYAVGAGAGGQTCGRGLHMIDIRQPKSPSFAGCFADALTGRAGTGYTHDAQCVMYAGPDDTYTGREICFGSNETALSIADVTDKTDPRALSRATYPDVRYAHQAWLTEDQRYLYMNDEADETGSSPTRTLIWDVADLEDPILVAEHMGVENATDHNLYVRGNLMYQANYRSGLRILDIADPEAPVEVAFFDTTPGGWGPGFQGAWSNYPFFDSGLIVVSSRGEGLFVLRHR